LYDEYVWQPRLGHRGRALEGGYSTLFVVSQNLHWRHLTTSQRAAVGGEMLPMLREEERQRQLAGLRKGSVPANYRNGKNLHEQTTFKRAFI
jgi:hypothetical protein